jgi:hypothetical protein
VERYSSCMMTGVRFLPLAILLFVPRLSGADAFPPPANPVADAIWADFQRALWDTPLRDWVGVESIGRGPDCQEFHGYSYDTDADGGWSYRCAQQDQNRKTEWLFYALTLDNPLTCRLERFQAVATGFPLPVLESIHQNLDGRLSARYGPGESPERSMGGFAERGSAYWHRVRRWQTKDVQIYLYISKPHDESAALGLLARHRHLVAAIAAERKQPYWFRWGRWLQRWGTPLDEKLVAELHADYKYLPALVLKEPAYPPKSSEQEEVRRTLRRLLVDATTAPPGRRPALLLAADRLAERWEVAEPPRSGLGEIRRRIGAYELSYVWNHLGSNWAYQHDLLWRVWNKSDATNWGELAFVLLLNHGWDTTVACGKGSDQFREVIQRGEQFLAERPKSEHRVDVLFVLAQAYETWWSLSKAHVQDSYVDRFRYLNGAESARHKALRYYGRILRLAPGGYEADYARLRVPRLMLGIDTNQRRFFCIYD